MGRKKKDKDELKPKYVPKERVVGTGIDTETCSRCRKTFNKLEPGWLWITGYVCQACVLDKKY